MTMEELQEDFESEMLRNYPGLFLDTMPNGQYSHPDVYNKWNLYKLFAKFLLNIPEE